VTATGHVCRFRPSVVWSGWERAEALRERTARRVPTCECGRQQPARRPRPPFLGEEEAGTPEALPLLDETGRAVALTVAGRGTGPDGRVPARGLLGALAARDIPGSVAEPWLDQLMRSGLIRLARKLSGRRELRTITILDQGVLEELARPGERAARAAAVASAAALLDGIDHPVVEEVRRSLLEEADTIAPDLARVLAAIARHAAEGDVLAERVFSARYLGSSKTLSRLRYSIEQRLGSLEALGIREGAALTLVGGTGRLILDGGTVLDLATTPPFLGLSRQTSLAIARLEVPARGLVAVENLTVFDACCRGEVPNLAGAVFVWTAGYPGRGARAMVEAATRAGAPVAAWCDLDLDGVRIARIVAAWGRDVRFYRMAAEDLRVAPRTLPLSERARRAIARELAGGREDALTATLAALAEAGVWAEQEAMLGRLTGQA
jgi:uncharacterized protein DUF2399